MSTLIQDVRRYAALHYDESGWDFVVECWTDEDIAEAIGKARTLEGAIRKILPGIKVQEEMRWEHAAPRSVMGESTAIAETIADLLRETRA